MQVGWKITEKSTWAWLLLTTPKTMPLFHEQLSPTLCICENLYFKNSFWCHWWEHFQANKSFLSPTWENQSLWWGVSEGNSYLEQPCPPKKKGKKPLSLVCPTQACRTHSGHRCIFNSFGSGIITGAEWAGMHNCLLLQGLGTPGYNMQLSLYTTDSIVFMQATAGSKIISFISHYFLKCDCN